MCPHQIEKFWMNSAPNRRPNRTLRRRPAGNGIDFIQSLHGIHRDFYAQIQPLRRAGVDDCDRANRSAEKLRYFFQRTLRGGKPNPLQLSSAQVFESFEGQRKMRSTLAGNQRMDLIDDHRFNRPQRLPGIGG